MNLSLAMVIQVPKLQFSGSSNCRWQNSSSATSACVVEALAADETHELMARESSTLDFGEKGTCIDKIGVSVAKMTKQHALYL